MVLDASAEHALDQAPDARRSDHDALVAQVFFESVLELIGGLKAEREIPL
jgi:hypothetical protein